jgi:hypothetical protein
MAGVLALLRIEGDARQTASLLELKILIANDTVKVMRAHQAFVFEPSASGTMVITAATGLAEVDRKVPLIEMLEAVVAGLGADEGHAAVRDFKVQSYRAVDDSSALAYPLTDALWVPFISHNSALLAAVLLTRNEPWVASDCVLATRLAMAFSQAWHWLTTAPAVSRFGRAGRIKVLGVTLGLAVLGAIPVSLTTLAPLEIAASEQVMITAPIDGVVAAVTVNPNGPVHEGDVLIEFESTSLQNRLAVAERELQVAEAHVKKTILLAVNDISGRHELAIAQAELGVKAAERDFARGVLARATVRAPRNGIAVFGDKRELVGRPLSTGERIMSVADPANIVIHADVPVSDTIILKPGARVRAYLDSDPLHPMEAIIQEAGYQAKLRESGMLAFRVVARIEAGNRAIPRLGARGTAQLYGDRVPLAYYLFRRPLSAARQWIGL